MGLSRGAGSDRGGEDGVASARPSCIQTQKILPLRNNRHRGRFPTLLYSHIHLKFTYIHTNNVQSKCYYVYIYLRTHPTLLPFRTMLTNTITHTHLLMHRNIIQALNTDALTLTDVLQVMLLLVCVLSIFMLTTKVFLEAFKF